VDFDRLIRPCALEFHCRTPLSRGGVGGFEDLITLDPKRSRDGGAEMAAGAGGRPEPWPCSARNTTATVRVV